MCIKLIATLSLFCYQSFYYILEGLDLNANKKLIQEPTVTTVTMTNVFMCASVIHNHSRFTTHLILSFLLLLYMSSLSCGR